MKQVLVTTTEGNTFAANVTDDQYGFITSKYLANISVDVYSEKALNESHGKYGKFKTYRELVRWLSCAENENGVSYFENIMECAFKDYILQKKALRICRYILSNEYGLVGEQQDELLEKIKRRLMSYIRGLNATTREKCRQCIRFTMRDYINAH